VSDRRDALRGLPATTPVGAFVAWNEARRRRDRRYVIMGDVLALIDRFGRDAAVAHLAGTPLIRRRSGERRVFQEWPSRAMERRPGRDPAAARLPQDDVARMAANLVDGLVAALASTDRATHAALFRAFEGLAAFVDLEALASRRPRHRAPRTLPSPRRILVIKLSALGDFVQALGPAAAIRRHHRGDHVTLLTTRPFAAFAEKTGYFDRVLIDRRPRLLDIAGTLALRRALRAGRFDFVYDLQTSDRSSLYRRLWWPTRSPLWSGIARGCSHPHANLARDPQHTIDKQAEQLLMAGIWPVPLPACPASQDSLPPPLAGRRFALLIPGSSPQRPGKRWPAECYGAVAQRLAAAGLLPVVLGGKGEEGLAERILTVCPESVDLVGQTPLDMLAGLAAAASLTVGNDTGVTHIAAAGGRPVVVLFSRDSDPARCAPRGGVVRVIAVPDLADLPVDRVFETAMAALGAGTA
jgi:ADP-heptose:LPS heptosyltransferase